MAVEYDINRPWLSLDDWQKEYIETDPNKDCFLLCGRQVGKTTGMSIKAVELCRDYKEGEFILICSITEKQAYHMLAKALVYAEMNYPKAIDKSKDKKPTMHRINFKNGTGIFCYAAGETGEGLRGYTIKKLMIDEGARMSEEFFIAVSPMLSVVKGSMDIASTPAGKKHPDGTEKFFFKCSKDDKFKKFYVNAEDCPRHSKEFLLSEKNRLSRLAYAQEYNAIFTDEIKRLFDDELIARSCCMKRDGLISRNGNYYFGVDVAGFGEDECSFEIVQKLNDGMILQKESITEKKNLTTMTTRRILVLDNGYKFRKIGVDDAGLGFGVFSELLNEDQTKRKTIALNNASREKDYKDETEKKLLKEEMYINLLTLMENGKIKLLDDDEVKESLSSIQHDEGKIFGSNSHITEGIIRAAWLASKDKSLNIFAHTF
jgi:hypothetical protein